MLEDRTLEDFRRFRRLRHQVSHYNPGVRERCPRVLKIPADMCRGSNPHSRGLVVYKSSIRSTSIYPATPTSDAPTTRFVVTTPVRIVDPWPKWPQFFDPMGSRNALTHSPQTPRIPLISPRNTKKFYSIPYSICPPLARVSIRAMPS